MTATEASTQLAGQRTPCKMPTIDRGSCMIELLRTNDIVLISRIEALLAEYEISVFVADQYMSAVEGSLGFLPRRMMIDSDDLPRARIALREAGLLAETGHG